MTLNSSSLNAKTLTGIAIVSSMLVLATWLMLHGKPQNVAVKKTNIVLVEEM